jgi:hypothetical protein
MLHAQVHLYVQLDGPVAMHHTTGVCFAVAGSITVFHILTQRQAQPVWKHLHGDIPIGSERQAPTMAVTSQAG